MYLILLLLIFYTRVWLVRLVNDPIFWVPLLLAVTDTEEATSIPWCSQCQSLEDWRPSWGLSSELGENRAQLLLMFERQFSRQDRAEKTSRKIK